MMRKRGLKKNMASTYEITLTEEAMNDADEIHESIQSVAWPESADRWLARIFGKIELLNIFSEGYAKCVFDDMFRCVKVGKYIIVYFVDKKFHRIQIIRIVYARRDLAAVKLRFFSI